MADEPAPASVRDELGATMVEFGLLVALVAMVVATAAGSLGTAVSNVFEDTGQLASHCDRDRGNSGSTPAATRVGGPQCQQ